MFTASSRQRDRMNPDGSSNVFCYSCGQFIARTYMRIGRALCEMCRRVENGEPLTEEAIRDYKLSKGKMEDVSMLLVPEVPPGLKKTFSFRSLGGELMQAIGLKRPEKDRGRAAEIARQKKRTRLFQNVDIGKDMQQLDEELRK